jgi:ferritin
MPTPLAAEKPSYLGLLNAISLAESNAGVYLRTWADATCDEDLACTLRFVAARETSHGELFLRRLNELGYDLRQKPDPGADKRLAKVANPRIEDVDKLPAEREERGDPFAEIKAQLADGRYDAMTANLLTWYIAEEVDSARRLRDAYGCVRANANGHAAPPSADAQAIMACMTAGFARLEKSLEKSLDKLARAKK